MLSNSDNEILYNLIKLLILCWLNLF